MMVTPVTNGRRSMKYLLAALAAVILTGLIAAPASALSTPDPYRNSTGYRPSAWAIGDSTMRRAYEELVAGGFTGEIDGVSSRSVEQTVPLVKQRVLSRSAPRTAVLGLGVNGGMGKFVKADYLTAINLLKKHGATRIVLIAPYRDQTWWDYAKVAERARWAQEIASADHGTVCLANWAAYASAHPEALEDGLHARPEYESVWAKIINDRALGPKWNCS